MPKKLFARFAWALIIVLIRGYDAVVMNKTTDMESFDASDVTWAHAVNSRKALDKELAGPVDFLEADVSLGRVKESDPLIPIMAHPPNTTSDISLKTWMKTVIDKDTGKGVKLDFKSLDAVEPSLMVLQEYTNQLNFSLWLNADILKGPVKPEQLSVEANSFLKLCHQYFPDAVVSAGWTTDYLQTYSRDKLYYQWKNIVKMADTIRCFNYQRRFPTITFPVRAFYASRSIRQLQWLLGQVPGSSLTVWSSAGDPLSEDDLGVIRKSFPAHQVYYDLPEYVRGTFQEIKNTTSYVTKKRSLSSDQWMTLTHGASSSCSDHTYISNSTVVFGQNLMTAVLLKTLLDDGGGLEVRGRVRFFRDYDDESGMLPRDNVLKMVLVDVSLFSRNSSTDLTESDTDVLWAAVNQSELYSFQQDTADGCRLFKLDSNAERNFRVWSVPCDPTYERLSFSEVTENGMQEVPYGKRVVLPDGPFMIGFVASGEGHVVVHDLEVRRRKTKPMEAPSSASGPTVACLSVLVVLLVSFALKRWLTG